MKTIRLKAQRDGSVRRFHPWVFSGAIASGAEEVSEGEQVQVQSHRGDILGVGHYQDASISVRLLRFSDGPIDEHFWLVKLQKAYQLRQHLGLIAASDTNCYRLVHGEGDGLPGLIIDIYDRAAVVQCHSIGMHQELDQLVKALGQLFDNQLDTIYDKSRSSLPPRYAKQVQNGFLQGNTPGTTVLENGHRFRVDWVDGQKTGFFLDQRVNRQLLSTYANGQRLLNAYSYTGGFSVYALAQGATAVDSVDLSGTAIEIAQQNVALNEGENKHRAIQSEVLPFLKSVEDPYDIIILDPPAFAKRPRQKHQAVQAYKRINAAAMQQLKPGGILFTFSCSQAIDRPLFKNTIVAAALDAKRQARIVHELGQGPDHPVSLHHPEGSYLKGLVLQMD